LRVLDADVEAERQHEAPGEQLNALFLQEGTRAGEERLKAVHVVGHCAGAATLGELGQGCGAQRWPVAEVQQLLEAAP